MTVINSASTGNLATVGMRIRSIIAASSGNLVEWFDFYVYAFTAVYFAPVFFPKADTTVQLLQSAGVFAAGFLMRPIGGWYFGRLADRRGRRHSLVQSVILMSAGSLLIALCPSYAQIGLLAPLVLLLARLLQGLSVGGEYGTTATYLSEIALPGRRGLLSSFQYVTLIGGQLMAVLVVLLMQRLLPDAALKNWGWRIPFVIGAVASLIALLLRRTLVESAPAGMLSSANTGMLTELWTKHRSALLKVFAYTAGGSLCFYTFTTYMQKYLVNTAGLSVASASMVMTSALLAYLAMQPVFGALADRIGTRNNMLIFGGAGMIATIPTISALARAHDGWSAFFLLLPMLAILSSYTAISAIVKAEMFPPELRATGVSLAYALGNALCGGSAEFVALSLKSDGHESWFGIYVSVALAVGFVVSLSLPTRPPYLCEDEHAEV
jgi:MHS family alpha-ketoglutarate permease-like MFS transporter